MTRHIISSDNACQCYKSMNSIKSFTLSYYFKIKIPTQRGLQCLSYLGHRRLHVYDKILKILMQIQMKWVLLSPLFFGRNEGVTLTSTRDFWRLIQHVAFLAFNFIVYSFTQSNILTDDCIQKKIIKHEYL